MRQKMRRRAARRQGVGAGLSPLAREWLGEGTTSSLISSPRLTFERVRIFRDALRRFRARDKAAITRSDPRMLGAKLYLQLWPDPLQRALANALSRVLGSNSG